MSDLSLKALEVAMSQIGQQEHPQGSNWGHPVQDYLASVGIGFPASWCMAFVYWSFSRGAGEMGVNNPLIRTGGVLNAWHMASGFNKVYRDFQPGDIFIQDHGGGLGHTGIVEFVDGGQDLHTVEGNTNDTGSREGFEVCRKIRKVSKVIGALRY
jgi:hypothetical protein